VSSHIDRCNDYARGVVAGKIPAAKYIRLACQKHVDDLKLSKKKEFKYKFDDDAASKACEFIELFPHVKGKWARTLARIVLEPWQCFILCNIFGWLRKSDKRRRYRSAYIKVPRKNGKSMLAAGIGLYMLLADKEPGAEIYSGATTEKQAWETFRPAKDMLAKTPTALQCFGVEVFAKSISSAKTGSRFEPVIGKPGDGSSPHCCLVDEYHEHDTPDLYNTMETGMGAREQPLMLVITTAGFNLAGPCYEKETELKRVLDGVVDNPELFGMIYGIDDEDDWSDPASLRKANPNYGVSVDAEFLESAQRQALQNPVQQNRFKTKHLNVWCSARAAWMNMQLWHLAGDPLLTIDELAGEECWFGIDLASKTDLCTLQILFRKQLAGEDHYYLFGRYWLPEDTVNEPGINHASYVKWQKQGVLTVTDGATVDFEQVTEEVVELMKRLNPTEVVFDPFNATQMSQNLMAAGGTTVEFTQTPQNFALPMDEILSMLKANRLHHDGNEMTTWCMSNVVGRIARKGLLAPTKERPENKIDGAVAAIMAMSRPISSDPKPFVIDSTYQILMV